MTKTCFGFRFVIDRDFFKEVMLSNNKVIHNLMIISNSSEDFRKEHNLMSEKIRTSLINDHQKELTEAYIKSALNKVNEPSTIEEITDEIERNIKYAIYYTTASPQKITQVCILTSDSKKSYYLTSPHLKDIKNVSVKSGQDAVALLEDYKREAFANS